MNNTLHHKKIDIFDLAAPFIRMNDAEAIQCIQDRYHLPDIKVNRLATEKDDTFSVTTSDGQQTIFKVGNPIEPADEIAFQIGLLKHIENVTPDLPVPRVIADREGKLQSTIIDSHHQKRQIRMMSFLKGQPLDSTTSTSAQRESIGQILAQLRLATASFDHPASERVLAWDVKNLMGLAHLIDNIDDAAHRKALSIGLDRFSNIESQVLKLRRQVLHNDFSKSNIVVNPDSKNFVTGIIDFGDAVKTAIAIDVSTAILNQLPRNEGTLPNDDPLADGRDILKGYLSVAELTNEELALIPHLVMARIITRALLSTSLAKSFPKNSPYLLRNTLQGWAQLDWFLARSPQQISDSFFHLAY